MGDLLKLAERVQSEPASYDLWAEAADAVPAEIWEARRYERFHDFVNAGAYLDAADMLRPVDHNGEIGLNTQGGKTSVEANLFYTGTPSRKSEWASAEGEHAMARAWLAVILRCHAAGGGNG